MAIDPVTGVETEKRTRTKAEYGLEEVDFLPQREGRKSQLNALLAEVESDHPDKWMVIAKYENGSAASATASQLRYRFGPVEANGWEFAVRKTDEGAKSALFAKFSPGSVKANATKAYDEVRAQKDADRLEKAAKKDKDKAKAEAKASK